MRLRAKKALLAELHLIEALLCDLHPTVRFSPTDNVFLEGAARALRWALGAAKAKHVSRLVRPIRRKVKRDAH